VEQKPILPHIHGRGATANPPPTRTGSADRIADGDWLDAQSDIDGAPAPLRTTVTTEHPKSIITRNRSPDISFDQSINPYRGCEHGCVYCFARPSHAFHDLSPGLDFESKLFAKASAAELLRAELAKPSYKVQPIAIGTNTDGYQPIEREWGITRSVIEVLCETRHPLILTTKSDRLLRDIDLLADMARDNLIGVAISVTTLDPAIARTLEPRAPHPRRRLEAVRILREAGIPTQVNISPIIPAITDHEIEAIMAAAAAANAIRASAILIRLPHEVAPIFRAWLDAHFPDRAQKVMNIIQSLRGGKDYDAEFFTRMKGQGVWADLIRQRLKKAAIRHGLNNSFPALRTDHFRPPNLSGQLSLF
jgi:DNA repair photolyase